MCTAKVQTNWSLNKLKLPMNITLEISDYTAASLCTHIQLHSIKQHTLTGGFTPRPDSTS